MLNLCVDQPPGIMLNLCVDLPQVSLLEQQVHPLADLL
jgi:hypothetical protein